MAESGSGYSELNASPWEANIGDDVGIEKASWVDESACPRRVL